MTTRDQAEGRRRWWKWGAGGAVIAVMALIAAVAAFPWWLGTATARRWLLGHANRALSPSKIEFDAIGLSWFGPARVTNFVLRDADGDRVIAAPSATWDRTLGHFLFDRPRYGTLTLDRAALSIDRRGDGTIDLAEALRPIITNNRRTRLHLRIRDAGLRFRDAGQPVPVTAGRARFDLEVLPAPRPVSWRLLLENPRSNPPESLDIHGTLDRWRKPADLALEVKGGRWPLAVTVAGVDLKGRLDGRFTLVRKAGDWASAGVADLLDLDAGGRGFAGDRLRLERLAGSWDLSRARDAWKVDRLAIASEVLKLEARGEVPTSPASGTTIRGTVDLAALAGQIPHALRLRNGIQVERGSAELRIATRGGAGAPAWEAEAKVAELQARDHGRLFRLHDPATLSARFVERGGSLNAEHLALKTPFLTANGRGDVDRGIEWTGTVDLGGARRQLRDLIDFGDVELAGLGELSGRYQRVGTTYHAMMKAELRDLRIEGVGPFAIRRPSLRLDLGLDGLATATGLPSGWEEARLDLEGGDRSVHVLTTSPPGGAAARFAIEARSPLRLGDRTHLASGTLAGRWEGDGATIDRLDLALAAVGVPEEKVGPLPPTLRLSLQGRYNRALGELVLNPPAADREPAGVALRVDEMRVTGIGHPRALGGSAAIRGEIEPLDRFLNGTGATTLGLSGEWSAQSTLRTDDQGLRMAAKLEVRAAAVGALAADPAVGDPVRLSFSALVPQGSDRLEVAELVVGSRFGTLEAAGVVDELGTARRLDLKGSVSPDWEAINRLVAERIEPGARLSGKSRAFRLRGPLPFGTTGASWGAIEGEGGIELMDADIYGLRLGPTPLVLRSRQGKVLVDPIDTTLNGGRIHLEPTIRRDDERGLAIGLGPESMVEGAEINDEVSRRFLSYVAPVLDRATRARGRVSVRIEDAIFPIGRRDPKGVDVKGAVVFQEVEFAPGPFVDPLFALIGRDDRPTLKLDEPVSLRIADRRVYQTGLALPIGRLTQIELDGWVDFDRNLGLTASLPLTPAMVGDRPLLGNIVAGTKVRVPIGGTLQRPEVDREAMNLALKDLTRTLLGRGAIQGAAELLLRMGQGRDPNAPPPLTPQQRRERRLERRGLRPRNPDLAP